jgi:leucyl aminopeptidase (aminopeptidase T)
MSDSAKRLAKAVLGRNLKVKKGENVLIETWPHTLSYLPAFVEEARRLGARPTVVYEDEDSRWTAVKSKQLADFQKLSETDKAAIKASDVFVYFWGPSDRPHLWSLPDKVQGKVFGSNNEWYKFASKAGLRGVRLQIGWASDPTAKFFGLDGDDWRSRMLAAGSIDLDAMRAKGEKVARMLKGGKELRLMGANGTDLTVQLRGVHTRVEVGDVTPEGLKRPFGMLANNPSGQVFVGIDDSAAEGSLVGNRGVYLGSKRYSGAKWAFHDGKLTDWSLEEGREPFAADYKKGGKGRDLLGYLSIGLNPYSRDLPPAEDTEEGAVLVGVGNNQAGGGKNKAQFVGYAMVGEGKLTIDGRTLADGGRIR